jgi:acetylornithine deacetylase/succinyl-diaminopimelate desuccinylase-like protein
MELERWITRTLEVQSIPAPSFEEAERASYMHQEFEAAGLREVHQDPIGNVLAKVEGGDSAPVIVSAHLDTVFSAKTDLTSRRTRTQLAGPGIGDNAVALAALLELAADLQPEKPIGDVWLIGNVGEEGLGNLRGMREVVSRFGSSVSAYLVLEGMALGHIYHRGLPSKRYRISSRTSGGHSWIHKGRPSAIHRLVELGSAVLQIARPEGARTSLNIGTIHGGRSINSIADSATMELDLRSEDEKVLAQFDERLQQLIAEWTSTKSDIELELIGARPGGALPARHPLVLAASESYTSVGERDLTLEAGSTDASIPLNQGLPAVCIGLTRGGEAHTLDEYIELGPMIRGYEAVRRLVGKAFSLEGNKADLA